MDQEETLQANHDEFLHQQLQKSCLHKGKLMMAEEIYRSLIAVVLIIQVFRFITEIQEGFSGKYYFLGKQCRFAHKEALLWLGKACRYCKV